MVSLGLLVVNFLIIWLGVFGLLSLASNPNLTQAQIITRAFPYTLILIAAYGVFGRKHWARLLMISISILGLALQIIEISIFPNAKDIIESLIFIIFILFFASKPIKSVFSY